MAKSLTHRLAYEALLRARADGRICEHCGNAIPKETMKRIKKNNGPMLCPDCYVAFKGVNTSVAVDPIAYEHGHLEYIRIVSEGAHPRGMREKQ